MTVHKHPESVEAYGMTFVKWGECEELMVLDCSKQMYLFTRSDSGIVLTRFSHHKGRIGWRANLQRTIEKGKCTPMGVGETVEDALCNLHKMATQECKLNDEFLERARVERDEFLRAACILSLVEESLSASS